MNILKAIIKEKSKIDFKFPKSFEQLMNSSYYDYDKFEWFLYYVFKLGGSSVKKIGKKGQGDGGADLIVSEKMDNGGVRRIGIQAKYWKNRVGSGPINQLASTRSRHDLTDLWIITTSDLTTDAKEIAESMDIKILRGADVNNLIEHVKTLHAKDIETNGDSPIEFLEEEVKPRKYKKTKSKNAGVEVVDSEIVERFKSLRNQLAKKHKLFPLYKVYTNAMIDDLTKQKPKSTKELLKVKGFGPVKVELIGDEILALVKEVDGKQEIVVSEKEQALYKKLIAARPRIAKFNKLNENDVYSDQVARNLAKMKPKKVEHLEKVYGFDKKNIKVFGKYLINLISKNI